MSRPSGRTDGQIRSLLCERSVISRADGSARWCQDQTSVVAAVYGPRAAGPKNEDPSKATLDVIFRPMSGIAGSREAEYERIISDTLTSVVMTALHPRTEVQVVLQVASDDGSLLPCAINAAFLALVDAGVPLKRTVAAVQVAFHSGGDGRFSLDPDAAEERGAGGLACVCVASSTLRTEEHHALDGPESSAGVLSCVLEGDISVEAFDASLEAARKGSGKLLQFIAASLGKGIKKQVRTDEGAEAAGEEMD